MELAFHRPFLCLLNIESVPVLDDLIVNGTWWDYVDRIASTGLVHVLSAQPKPVGGMIRGWARDVSIWRRRAALLYQLGFKEDTDLALLYDRIGACMGHRELFVQKAIGWVLRDYAWTEPGEVRRYFRANGSSLRGLPAGKR